jgi:hypothetical protein
MVIKIFNSFLVISSSMRVADEAYNCPWYERNLKFRKIILLTMLRAQQPQVLTALKFFGVGMEAFYWVRNVEDS